MTRHHVVDRLIACPPGASVASLDPFKCSNALVDHPLFEPARIKRLLRTLPAKHIEIRSVHRSADAAEGYRRGPRVADVDPVDAFERLDEKPAWMLLHDTWEHDKDYGQLLKDYVSALANELPDMDPDVSDLGCWMFLSSGRSVVHFHADPDQSFLNQIKGSKTVFVYPERVLPEAVIERLAYTSNQGHVTYDPAFESRLFDPAHIAPGESVFLPLYAPHRVTNDDGISISWNVGFHTRQSRRRRAVHLVNLELRMLGLEPAPYGQNVVSDTVKAYARIGFTAKNRLFHSLKPRIQLKEVAATENP